MKTIRIGTYYPTSYEKVVDLEISDTLFEVMTQLDHKWNLIHRQDRRYHHRGGFIEGETEQHTRAQYRTIEDEVIQHDDAQRVREALSGLTDVQQRRVKAYFFEQLSYVQIANMEGISPQAARHSVQDALKKLKVVLR